MLGSIACRSSHFSTAWYKRWSAQLDLRDEHRKAWEWAAISQALEERCMLQPGKLGVGFAVGNEMLPSLFASRGAEILATDIGDEKIASSWREANQYAGTQDDLYVPSLLSKDNFSRLVTYKSVDMRSLADFKPQSFDFLWSACALEHLGSLEAGLKFIEESTKLLKSGGVGVHTTEYNISSDDDTLFSGETVIYREKDLRSLSRRLRRFEAGLATLDLDAGIDHHDLRYDYAPYHNNGRKHIKLLIGEHVATSVLLIVQR